MTIGYAFLAACIGVGAYLVTAGVAYLGSRARQWARYHDAHERTVDLAHEVVRAHAYVLRAEAALAREVEGAPEVERRRFATWARDMAGALPPLLLAQLRRFGLAEPPPVMAAAAPVSEPVVTVTAVDEDAWGGEG